MLNILKIGVIVWLSQFFFVYLHYKKKNRSYEKDFNYYDADGFSSR